MNLLRDKRLIDKPAAILLGLILSACGSAPSKNHSTFDQIDNTLNQDLVGTQTSIDALPSAVADALIPSINIDIDIPDESVDQRFDIAAQNTPVREFFMSLMKGTSFSIVVHPDIKGEISLTLNNVSIDEVLNVVRDIYGYEYRKLNAVYTIMPQGLESQIFHVNYLDIKRTGTSDIKIGAGQSSSPSSTGTDASSSGSSTTTTSNLSGTTIKTDSEINFWSDLEKALSTIVGDKEGRQFVVNPMAGVIIVMAMPDEIRRIREFIDTLQNIVQRQVIIEAKIVEVELNDGFQSGINWASLQDNNKILGAQTGGGTIFSGSGVSDIKGNSGTLDPGNFSAIQGTVASAFGGVFSLALNSSDFNAFIELLSTQGNAQVLSSPRVSTINNQKAVIKVGTDEYFVTGVSATTTTTSAGETSTPDITLTPFFSGISLDVTPQIDEHGDIILHIHPSVSEVSDQTKSLDVLGKPITIPLAKSNIRESDNLVRAKNGQLVVIGGLMQSKTTEEVASVPVLGDIPFLGALFRHTKQVSKKSELVLLLRPIVITDGSEWSQATDQSSSRIKSMKRGFHLGGKPQIFGTRAEW